MSEVFHRNQIMENQIAEMSDKLKPLQDDYDWGYPKGHFYSSVHSLGDLEDYLSVKKREEATFSDAMPTFSSKRLVKEFNSVKKYFKDFRYSLEDDGKSRFYVNNVSLGSMDSLMLFSMIRAKKPKKIIEIGSGFSSGLIIDINEKYFNDSIDITFIEPFPYLLQTRMKEKDRKKYKIIEKKVQDTDLNIFKTLESGDLLIIDSTHVSKFNSDVNYEIFHILPALKAGVLVYFHDVLDGFEYPLHWLKDGWAWNEQYLLRAFLMNNRDYEIFMMTNFMTNHYPDLLKQSYKKGNTLDGGQLWIRKIR